LDEAGRGLRVFILRGGALGPPGPSVEIPIAPVTGLPDPVLMMKPDVEPDGRIERPILVHAEPSQFVVENLAVRLGEIAILDSPVGDCPSHAVDQLPHRTLAL